MKLNKCVILLLREKISKSEEKNKINYENKSKISLQLSGQK